MATQETIKQDIPRRTKSKNHIPNRNTPGRKNFNPVGVNDISVSNTGVVQINKGKVYVNMNTKEGAEASASPGYFAAIVMRDEFDNLVEITRNSNVKDTSSAGEYVNNQSVRSVNPARAGFREGSPVRNVNAKTGLNEI